MEDAAFDARVAGNPLIAFDNAVDATLMVEVDAGQMGRVLVNLLKNAREALEAVPGDIHDFRIEARASADAERTVITLRDNGPGLPPRARKHLFVAFEGSARSGGTGLGLAIAREITEAHGGVLAHVEEGQGTRFDITLPARRKEG